MLFTLYNFYYWFYFARAHLHHSAHYVNTLKEKGKCKTEVKLESLRTQAVFPRPLPGNLSVTFSIKLQVNKLVNEKASNQTVILATDRKSVV